MQSIYNENIAGIPLNIKSALLLNSREIRVESTYMITPNVILINMIYLRMYIDQETRSYS